MKYASTEIQTPLSQQIGFAEIPFLKKRPALVRRRVWHRATGRGPNQNGTTEKWGVRAVGEMKPAEHH
jgi:hypothetical protein